MRSFLTYGLISLVGVSALYACGDDSDDGPNTGGTGGTSTAGQGGSGGASGGSGGSGGVAGSAPNGGNGGSGGAAPDVTPQATCTGCVELITPVTGPNSATNLADQAIFQFNFPAPGVDFTNGVITWRVMPLQNNDNLFLNTFAQNGPPDGYNGVYPTFLALSTANFPAGQWRDVVLDLSAYRGTVGADAGTDAGEPAVVDAGDAGGPLDPGAFIKERVQAIGIQIGAGAAFTGSTTVRLAVDSVTITGVPGQPGYTFDANAQGLAANTYELPPGTPAPAFH